MPKSKYTPGNFSLRVGKSATGKGLFAEEDIPKDVCIVEYTGKPIPEAEAIVASSSGTTSPFPRAAR